MRRGSRLGPLTALAIFLACITLGIGLGATVAWLIDPSAFDSEPITPPCMTITEDDPRWDCHTMGNRLCGRP